MRKVLIATPLIGGLSPSYVEILVRVLTAGIPDVQFGFSFLQGSPVNIARNQLAQHAIDGNFDELVFWDKDLKPTLDQFRRLLSFDGKEFPIVCCLYPGRRVRTVWHVNGKPGHDVLPNRLQRVEKSAIGFSRLTIEALLEIAVATPDQRCKLHEDGNDAETLHNFFPMQVYDGELCGEDYGFCRMAGEANIPIHVDTETVILHRGEVDFPLSNGELTDALAEDWRKL